ncbi:MAG: SIMPL domain-containing protein [Planctomycetota bacterium]|nr:SIMPL domain-containing protein [Planctomycetota bacterium]
MEYKIRIDLLRSAGIIILGVAVSLVVSTAVAARAYRGRFEDQTRVAQTLDVKGLARKRIRSDVAVWQIVVKGEGAALRDAYDVLDRGMESVLAFLRKREFAEDAIRTGAIGTETHYARDDRGRETRKVESYSLSRTLTVTTGALERVAAAAGKVTELIKQDVLVVSQPPEYYYTRIADLKIELMGLASRDARARAEEIARNAGCTVGEVRAAHMGVLQVTRPHSTEVRSYGIYDTGTIDKDVRAVVTVTFGVQAQ